MLSKSKKFLVKISQQIIQIPFSAFTEDKIDRPTKSTKKETTLRLLTRLKCVLTGWKYLICSKHCLQFIALSIKGEYDGYTV
jgi:hypothetical protein